MEAQNEELGPVDMKLDIVLIGRLAEGLLPGGPRLAGRPIADVAKLAPAIAGRILAPAGHVETPPCATTGAGGGDHHSIPAVGKQGDGRVQCIVRGGAYRPRG